MSVLVWLLILMMMAVMKSDAGSAEIIRVSANSSGSIVLHSGLQDGPHRYDIRWTQIPHLLLNRNRSTCSHRRCELLADGSLQFSHAQSQDSGNYTLEVFDETGKRNMTKHFLLQVKDSSSSSSPVAASVSVCIVLLVLLLFFVVFFILRKRRSQRMPTTGHQEANVYMVMKDYRGNEKKDEKSPEREEEPLYVPCKPAGSSQHEEGVYV